MSGRTDTERLDQFEALLRRSDRIHEFWFDSDAVLLWAGDCEGDDLRRALDHLLDSPDPEDAP